MIRYQRLRRCAPINRSCPPEWWTVNFGTAGRNQSEWVDGLIGIHTAVTHPCTRRDTVDHMAVYRHQELAPYGQRIRRSVPVELPTIPLSKAVIRFF